MDWDVGGLYIDNGDFEFGMRSIEGMKVVTPEGRVELRKDERWEVLTRLGTMFANREV